jgi:hypothetical protein
MIRGVIENNLRPSYRLQVDIIQAYLTLPFRHAYSTLMLLVQKSGKGTALQRSNRFAVHAVQLAWPNITYY